MIRFFTKGQWIIGLLLFGLTSFAQDVQSIAHHKTWLHQLQYRKTIFGNFRSEADGGFFISPKGKTDPVAELQATLELFTQNPEKQWGYVNQPVVCAFPTRKKFIEEQFQIKIKDLPCPDREEWMLPLLKAKVYMVFSDAFPNNPASMFGHTFLLFSKNSPPDSAKGLLDYAVNFAADTNTNGERSGPSVMETIKGLFGAFPGRYRLYKFYELINVYVDSESRDLWYLDLKLTEDQTRRLLDHIWEIFTTTHFDYYFLDENCSYRLMAALDYANPSLNLIDEFHYSIPLYYVSPLSTFRRLGAQTLSKDVTRSPSIRKRLKAQLDSLSSEQAIKFKNLRKNIQLASSENDIAVLDTLATYFDYQKRVASSDYLPEETLKNLQSVLVKRASIDQPSPPLPTIPVRVSPLDSHLNRAFWLGGGQSFTQNYFSLGARASYHELLDPTDGYERWSHLTALDFEIWQNEHQTELEHFYFTQIKSFFPMEMYEHKPSWTIQVGYNSVLKEHLKGGIGASLQTENEKNLAFAFINPVVSSNTELTEKSGVLVEGDFGISSEVNQNIKVLLEHSIFYQHRSGRLAHDFAFTKGSLVYFISKNSDLKIESVLGSRNQSWILSSRFRF